MYISLTVTGPHAADLNYLVHKHPDRLHERELPVGRASVFTSELTDERATVVLLLEVDAIGLVRGKNAVKESFTLGQYVNDRPYTASSLLASALRKSFSSALAGTSTARPDAAIADLPLTVHLPALPSTGGVALLRNLFEPLGWSVAATEIPLDPEIPEWGPSRLLDATLSVTSPLSRALGQIFLLLPVLDDAKHYWVDHTEGEKLIRIGDGWLAGHPLSELIIRRYLVHQRDYVGATRELLGAGDNVPSAPSPVGSLAAVRRDGVLDTLREIGATTVIDMGCGQGALLRVLLNDPRFVRVLGADVSASALAQAERALDLEHMPDSKRARLELVQSSVTYRDDRLTGFDACVLMEVIEHLDPDRLPSLERSVFVHAHPRHVLISTPNAEYNVLYPALAPGALRHSDHRFEWTRAEFAAWADAVALRHGYRVRYPALGDVDPVLGAPTQLAIFTEGVSA